MHIITESFLPTRIKHEIAGIKLFKLISILNATLCKVCYFYRVNKKNSFDLIVQGRNWRYKITFMIFEKQN